MADVGSINKVILLGYLGADPVLEKDLNSKSHFCNISIATREKFKGVEKPLTTWHNCTVWGKWAENIARYGKAGSLVAVTGKLRGQQWESKDGEKRYRVKIVIDEITIVGGKIRQVQDEPPPEENPEEDELDQEEEEKEDDPPY